MALTEKLTAVADAIREKTGKTDGLTLDQMAAEIASIETGGGASDESPLDYARACEAMFQGVDFGGGKDFIFSFGSKSNQAVNGNSFKSLFSNANGLRSIKIIYEGLPSEVYCSSAFHMWETELETIDLVQAVDKIVFSGNASNMFNGRQGLKEILGEMDFSKVSNANTLLRSCVSLEQIRFKPGTLSVDLTVVDCAKLSDESIQSIIDGLADLTGGTAKTLTLHATVGAKLTDAQKSSASSKNWTISY